MLWSAGLPLPKAVFGHGFVTAADGQKMSKSIGNVVDPVDVLKKFPADTFRYYMLRCGVYGADVAYSEPAMALTHNADLADTLGNLVHRVANLSGRMCGGVVPDVPCDVIFDLAALRGLTEAAYRAYDLQNACELAINSVKDINKYLTGAGSPEPMPPHVVSGRKIHHPASVLRTAKRSFAQTRLHGT